MKYEQVMKRLGAWAFAAGMLSVFFYVLHDVIGGMHYPGYDRMTQAVSDLTAVNAPSYTVASGLTSIHGVFTGICCACLCIMAHDLRKSLRLGILLFSAMHGVSVVGYSLFPLTGSGYDGSFQSFMHVYVVTVLVVLLSIVSLILIAVGSFRDQRKGFGILAVIALLCMFFGAVGSVNLPKKLFGIVERFSTYSAVLFTGILGAYAYFQLSKTR